MWMLVLWPWVQALIAEIDEDGDKEINFKEYLVAVSKVGPVAG